MMPAGTRQSGSARAGPPLPRPVETAAPAPTAHASSPPARGVSGPPSPSASPSRSRIASSALRAESPERSRRHFHRALRKALHCAAIAGEYEKKAAREEAKCSVDAAMRELQRDSPVLYGQHSGNRALPGAREALLALAQQKIDFHRQKARWNQSRAAHCQQLSDRYIARARALLPRVGEMDDESLRALRSLVMMKAGRGAA